MSEHLTSTVMNRFADGELSQDQVAGVNEHLATCNACTANALSLMVLKSTTARAGQRYALPAELKEKLVRRAASEAPTVEAASRNAATDSTPQAAATQRWSKSGWMGWAAAAAVLVASLGGFFFERGATARVAEMAMVGEASDQHITALAANQPQVLSSDRHTVKPWFQGKIPFSFNLPEGLPDDTKLDGANLAYLRGQPTAQLMYSIGKHRVSVFVRERGGSGKSGQTTADRSGFHVVSVDTPELELMAVSDVDPARLRGLVDAIARAQSAHASIPFGALMRCDRATSLRGSGSQAGPCRA